MIAALILIIPGLLLLAWSSANGHGRAERPRPVASTKPALA